jgi:DNA polymerase III alpha subunit
MYEAEKIGFDKYDILSQRGIGHIKEAVRLVEENLGKKVDVHQVRKFMKDPKLNGRLKIGDTIGCFYIESPAMRQLLTKLNCDSYLVLVAASSIIRPGVASSGMMPAYIRYHHDPSKVVYLHPVMEEMLGETYGVMVYQEDVIKICIHFAGMDGTDADILRRGMSGKYRSKKEFDRLVERFFWRGPQAWPARGNDLRGLETGFEFCRLQFFQGPFGKLCGGKLSEPFSKNLFPKGVYGRRTQ